MKPYPNASPTIISSEPHQQIKKSILEEDGPKLNDQIGKRTKHTVVLRRQISTLTKTLLKFIFKNNNLLLMFNIANALWKSRLHFIIPLKCFLGNAFFVMKHDGYKKLAFYSIHFVHYHFAKNFLKQQQKTAAMANGLPRYRPKNPVATAMLILSTTGHLLSVLNKIGNRWLSRTIKSMGGMDSILLAISTIIFTKSIQSSSRIF